MCTLHYYRNNPHNAKLHMMAISNEWHSNPDGAAIMFIRKHPVTKLQYAAELIQAVDLAAVLRYLKYADCYSVIVHLRGATTSITGLPGCHGFHSPYGDYTVFHNGVVPNPEGYRVDSMVISEYLEQNLFHGDTPIHKFNLPWGFANLLVWDNVSQKGYAHASECGTLYRHRIHGISTRVLGDGWQRLAIGWYPLQ
jgi:predicted glutamine amidotransferase